MDFRLTDEQELLVDTAMSLFTRECPSTLVRGVAQDPQAARPLFDRHLGDWVALSGGPLTDLCLFLTQAGVAVAPGPFLATAGFFAPLLVAAGHVDADAAATGEITGTVAVAGPDGTWVVGDDDDVRSQVIDADLVDLVAVVLPGPELAVVPVADLDLRRIDGMDVARGWFTADISGVAGGRALDPVAFEDAVERMTLAVAAEAVGVAGWLVDAAVAYAKERVQFGKPIGSFQAVQHKLVDASLAVQQASAAVSYAAMCVDADDPDRHRAAHVAKAEAGRAARRAAKDSLQVHGGIGYTWEHDLHLRLRRAYADDALCGTATWHLDRLSALIF